MISSIGEEGDHIVISSLGEEGDHIVISSLGEEGAGLCAGCLLVGPRFEGIGTGCLGSRET